MKDLLQVSETAYFDPETGLLSRDALHSEAIYLTEQARVFGRCWLFVAPGVWLGIDGAYVATTMGEVPVVIWRTREGVRAFVNCCPGGHGTLVTRHRGTAERLTCTCHGWHFDEAGGVDGRPHVRLLPVPQVSEWCGLFFATFDTTARPLVSYIGDFAWYLEMLFARRSNGAAICCDEPVSWRVATNWKVPAEAFAGDVYREFQAQRLEGTPDTEAGMQVSAGRGAIVMRTSAGVQATSCTIDAYDNYVSAEVRQNLGSDRSSGMSPLFGTLFPNLSFDWRTRSLHVWQPRGVAETEVQTYCFADVDAPESVKAAIRQATTRYYGPAGLWSCDDAATWHAVSRHSRSRLASDSPLSLQMGLGITLRRNVPGVVGPLFSEMNQRSFYTWWNRQVV